MRNYMPAFASTPIRLGQLRHSMWCIWAATEEVKAGRHMKLEKPPSKVNSRIDLFSFLSNPVTLFSACCIVHYMLTNSARLDVMNRLGRAMADPTRSRILLTLLEGPEYPAALAHALDLTRSNVSNHLACLRDCGIVVGKHQGRQTRYEIADPHLAQALTALVDTTLAVDVAAPCIDPVCTVAGCAHDEELSA